MRKVKVMHVLASDRFSGAENVVITIINHVGSWAESVYVSREGAIREVLSENKICYYPVKKLSIRNLLRAIKDIKPDVIHAHDFSASVMAALMTSEIPIISHIHNNPPWIKKVCIRTIVYAFSSFRYRRILTVSKAVMDEYVFGKWLKRKTEVVGNPIDLKRVCRMAEEDITEACYDVAFLGRISSPKNPFLFLEIMKELKKSIPDIQAVMIGDGELRNAVLQRIGVLELQENINMLGFQKNPYAILKKCKVLCMPSEWEGFGLAAIEAMTLGKPVVCSGAGGLRDIVTDTTGKCCNRKEEYADELKKLLLNEEYYVVVSANAVKRASMFMNLEVYIKEMEKLYLESVQNN